MCGESFGDGPLNDDDDRSSITGPLMIRARFIGAFESAERASAAHSVRAPAAPIGLT